MRYGLLLGLCLLATAVTADTIYKYRQADGRIVYSNRVLPGATVLETFEHTPPPQRALEPQPGEDPLAAEQRIRARLEARETAWKELQDAREALAQAEERLHAGIAPRDAEPQQVAGPTPAAGEPAALASPAVGGPLPPAPPAVGGPQPAAPAAVGGPMGKRHGGGGRSFEYSERQAQLQADVKAAEDRLDEALRRYNSLR